MRKIFYFVVIAFFLLFYSCQQQQTTQENFIGKKAGVKLTSELTNSLTDNQKQMIRIFIEISEFIDSMFFYENYGNINELKKKIKDSSDLKLININYGPWDNATLEPLIEGFGKKPEGANYYPQDMTKEEFLNFTDSRKYNHYTFIRRDSAGKLICIPYHKQFEKYTDTVEKLFLKAAALSKDTLFAKYLTEKAKAFKTDDYSVSDSIWVNLENNKIDFLVGPTYVNADKLFYLKADHLSVVLIKDTVWSKKMRKYNIWLKYLQKALPVPDEYKAEAPKDISKLYVYDAVYFAGASRAPGMLISLVQPLDTRDQLKYGVKNLQFRNIIYYKFDKIVKPIGETILEKRQLKYLNDYAFFVNTLLWEIGGSLGVKNTIDSTSTVRDALKENYIITEYVKNNVMTLYLAQRLAEVDEIQNDLKENYTTFIVDLIRGLRFGVKSSYSIANLITLNYLIENKAITVQTSGKLHINFDKLYSITSQLLQSIITMQGNGDYEEAKKFVKKYNLMPKNLYILLEKLKNSNIPVDIYPIQGSNLLDI